MRKLISGAVAFLAICALAALPASSEAQTYTWDPLQSGTGATNGSATWDATSTNWWNGTSNVALNDSSVVARIGTGTNAGGPWTINLSGSLNVAGLYLNTNQNSGAYTLTGGTLAIANSGTVRTPTGLNGAIVATIASTIVGNNISFAKDGGTQIAGITLSGNNLLTGTTTLAAGNGGIVLRASSANAFGLSDVNVSGGQASLAAANATFSNNFFLNGSTALGISAAGVVVTGTVTLTGNAGLSQGINATSDIRGPITESGGLARNLTFSGQDSRFKVTLSGSNSYTGTTTINVGTVQLAKTVSLYGGNTASWTKENLTVNSGATLNLNVGGSGEFSTGDVTSTFAVYAAKLTAFSSMRRSFRGPTASSGNDKIYLRMLRRFSSASMSANDGSRLVAYHA